MEEQFEKTTGEVTFSQSIDFLDNVINAIEFPIVVMDHNCRWISTNNAMCNLLGYCRSEIIGKSDYDLFPKEQADVLRAHEEITIASGETETREENITIGGQPYIFSIIRSSFINSETGERNIVCTAIDVSTRKHAEHFIRRGSDTSEFDEILENCISIAIDGSEADCCGLYLTNDNGSLTLHSHSGLSQSFAETAKYYPPDSPNVKLVLNGESIFTHYNKLNIPINPSHKKEQLKAFGIIPIKHNQKVIGCLNVGSHTLETIPKVSQEALITLSSIIGQYISRKQTEESMIKNEEKHRLFFENSPLGITHYSDKGIVTATNKSSLKIFGTSEEKLIGLDLHTISDQVFSKEILRALKGEKGHYEGYYESHTSTKKTWVKADFFPVIEGGIILSGFGIVEDITKQKQAEIKLIEREKKYRNLFEKARIGLSRTRHSDGVFIEANQRLAEILGYNSPDELIGKLSILDFILEPETRAQIKSELQENNSIENYELRFRKKDGSTGWARFSITLFKEKGYTEGVFTEITRAKEAEREKKQIEKHYRQVQKVEAIGRLAAGVAHDMNNLLTPILGYSELLMTNLRSNDKLKRYAEQITQAGYRSRDLVHQLLAFGRKQTLDYRPLNLNLVIQGFEKLLERTIREDVEINIIKAPDIETVKADRGQIEQVIMNLSVNAQDAMKDGGRLTIETSMVDLDDAYAATHTGARAGRHVMLAVSDTGSGMDEDTREHIFEPFFSTKGEQGTGLGLATVYGIIKQHKGNIWVYSEPGEGTTFKVFLPVSEEVHLEKKPLKESTGNLRGSETMLLVEDNKQVRELSHTAMLEHGYTVLVAESGTEALTLMSAHNGLVDLLLTDVIMPGMNGKELFNQALAVNPDLKVLYMSGYTDDVIAHHGILDEGVQYIQKPFTVKNLATRVREVIEQD